MAKKPLKRPSRAAGTTTPRQEATATKVRPGANGKAGSTAQKAPTLDARTEPASEPPARRPSCPIVGVGASAGGLEAFTEFLTHLPPAPGLAFVLLQHLDPTHESQLPELLARATPLPVTEVRQDTPVDANHVYLLSPGKQLHITDGVLRLLPRPAAHGPHLPIDVFLRSLAADQGGNAFGIILSGTATDGTLGLEAIKAEGGITFAQEPRSAKFGGMPRSAIAAGVVDFVLPPAEIARQMISLARHTYVQDGAPQAEEPQPDTEVDFNRVFTVLRAATGVDFRQYKRNTIQRRLYRRMALRGAQTVKEYVLDLQRHPAEVRALYQDLLITVTAFFRDPDALSTLRHTVLPQLFSRRSPDDPLRVWVAGCATGEEAYSLAMCLTEFVEEAATPVRIQVFATDLSEPAIDKARAGLYLESALGGVSPERRQRFFVKTNGHYQISKTLRDLCVFAKHNVAEDPPFSKVDIISCCNVLIYFGPVLQQRVLAKFQYALKPTGFLLLGSTESVSASTDLFRQMEKKYKVVYVKNPPAAPQPFAVAASDAVAFSRGEKDESLGDTAKLSSEAQKEADRLVLAQYAPAGVIIDEAANILHIRGQTGPYLELAPGEPSYDLFKIARVGLLGGLRTAIRKALQQNVPVRQEGLRVHSQDHIRQVAVQVTPLKSPSSPARSFLVLFEDMTPSPVVPGAPARTRRGVKAGGGEHEGDQGEITHLRHDLAATREHLQALIEEQEAANEELKSANEEAQANNEELETAKEELQSANEELTTLNDEMRTRNVELGQLNSDLTNLLDSLTVPLVMVSKDLRIRRFTPAMEPLLNLIASDLGRPLTDLQSNLYIPNLRQLLREVIAGALPIQQEVQDPAGNWYILRILPYIGLAHTIEGAVLYLLDITMIKRSRDYAAALVETVREPLVVLTADLRVQGANKAFYETFHVAAGETENRSLFGLGSGQWDIPALRELLASLLPHNSQVQDFEAEHNFPTIGRKTMLLNARQVEQPEGREQLILLAIEDITARKQAQAQLESMNEDLKLFAYAASHELQEPLRMVTSYTQLLGRKYADKLDAEAQQFIATAVEGARRMEVLLRDLREYWQVSERDGAHRTTLDCTQVLEKTLGNLQVAITDSGAVVTHDPLPTVVAEELLLVQLFQNLIGNALKYRSERPPQIHVFAQAQGGEWRFAVRDNGIGIAPQHLDRIFGMFTRLHGHTYPGTGIGLALCRKLVERYGGRIWVESAPGQGSTFFFTLPAQKGKL